MENNTRYKYRYLLPDCDNIIFKKFGELIYMNYETFSGKHYYGWNKCIDYLFKNNKECFEKIKLKDNVLFNDWFSKLFYWNMYESKYFLDELKNYKFFITFLHVPHNENFLKLSRKEQIYKCNFEIISDINSDTKSWDNLYHDNNKLLDVSDEIINKILFLFVLSNDHKNNLCQLKPTLIKKIISIKHPIEQNNIDDKFNISLYLKKKKKNIIHIGWWLRNFKIFCDTKFPKNYEKNLIIKRDFSHNINWLNLKKNLNLDDVNIINELSDIDYINLITKSIVFIYLENATANNTILECIQHNIPIIVNKNRSVVEYLGLEYPMYYEDILPILNDDKILEYTIAKGYDYLKNMNKKNISLDYFNKKFKYHISNFSVNKNKKKLTWICHCFRADNFIESFIQNFLDQEGQDRIQLYISNIVNSHDKNTTNEFISKIGKKYENIKVFNLEKNEQLYDTWNICIKNTDTEYVTLTNISDRYMKDYSNIFIKFLDNTPVCDIAISSYIISPNFIERYCKDSQGITKLSNNYKKQIDNNVVNQNNMINSCPVWRKKIHDFIGYFDVKKKTSYYDCEIWLKALDNNFNIIFIDTADPLYIHYNIINHSY